MANVQEQLDKTRDALTEVQGMIARDESKLEDKQNDLGDALAAARVGERGASKKASTLSMDAGKLKSSIDTLRSEERALERRIAHLESELGDSEAEATRERIRAMKQRTEEAENEFAALLDKAWDVGRELLQLDRQWNYERRRNGMVIAEEMPVPPKSPTRLANSSWHGGDNDQQIIAKWKNPARPGWGKPRQRMPHDPPYQSPVHSMVNDNTRITIRSKEGAL